MGMTAEYRRIPVTTLDALRADPSLAEEFLTPMVMADGEGGGFPIPKEALGLLESLSPSDRKRAMAQMQSLLSKAAAMASAVGKPALASKLTNAPVRQLRS
jgi:hypothetical protein